MRIPLLLAFLATTVSGAERPLADVDAQEVLQLPPLANGPPAAGKRVAVTPPEYAGTDVFHTLYLPPHWKAAGEALPIIFEYTGNYFPTSGSTGEPEDAALGFGLSAGQFIWVSLPFVSADRSDNAVTWWGDEEATIDYTLVNVPRIIREFGANPDAVILCGFSRGAIAVNYIGLHNDAISRLWSAFVTHDHFDGVQPWRGTTWGTPLDAYRRGAAERLQRVGTRPYLVSQNGGTGQTQEYLRSIRADLGNFTFLDVDTTKVFGTFPDPLARHPHTDRWLLKPSTYRSQAWLWIDRVVSP